MVALEIRRPGFYFWLCHWPAKWLKTNGFYTPAKFNKASARPALSHSLSSCPFTAPLSHAFAAQPWLFFIPLIPSTGCSLSAPSRCASYCNWGTGTQGRRGRVMVLLGAVPWDTFTRRYLHQLSVHVTRLDMPRGAFFMSCNFHLHISHRLRCGKSRSLFLFGVSLYSLLYSLLYYVHWHYNCLAQGYHFSLSTWHKRAPALLKTWVRHRLRNYSLVFLLCWPSLPKITSVALKAHHW